MVVLCSGRYENIYLEVLDVNGIEKHMEAWMKMVMPGKPFRSMISIKQSYEDVVRLSNLTFFEKT